MKRRPPNGAERVVPHFLKRLKDYALPIAIVLGIVFYRYISMLALGLPYMIIGMLFFSFLKLSPADLKIGRSQLLVGAVQLALSIGSYYILLPFVPESIAQGAMISFLTPAASASPVMVAILGGSVALSVGYVLLTTLSIAFIAPLFFSVIAPGGEGFFVSVWAILKGVLPIIVTPLVIALGMRFRWPKVQQAILKVPQVAFWLWVVALAVVIAKTVDYMSKEPASEIPTMIWLSVVGLVSCTVQFSIGQWLSRKLVKNSVSLGQPLGQKNSSLGIWMAQTYLNPISGVVVAAYSIWQNSYNAVQLVRHNRRQAGKTGN